MKITSVHILYLVMINSIYKKRQYFKLCYKLFFCLMYDNLWYNVDVVVTIVKAHKNLCDCSGICITVQVMWYSPLRLCSSLL